MFGTSSKNHWCRILVLLSMENDLSRSSYRSCSVKKVFLEVSRNSQENTCPESLFNKVNNNKGLRPATLLKKRLFHRCFPVNFAKFLRTPFLQNTSGRLLLYIHRFWLRHLHSNFKFDHESICGVEIRHHFSW